MITRKDVAKKANVSITVVTRVMNNSGYVSEEKREAVLKAAGELKYRPNPVARSLQKGKSKQILFYVEYLSNFYYLELYKGMLDSAQKRGYVVFVSGDLPIRQINELMIDGVILPTEAFAQEKFVKHIKNCRLPYIVIGYGEYVNPDTYCVSVDTGKGMRVMLGYLQKKGHRDIAFVSMNTKREAEPRYKAFREEMQSRRGGDVDCYILGPSEDLSHMNMPDYFEIGVLAASQFIGRNLRATAVICFNDDVAIGFCQHMQAHGYRVPEDVSVVGFDGHAMGKYTTPTLTSISLRTFEHGQKCADTIIDILEDVDITHHHEIEVELVERGSVKDLANAELK